jgi:GNAT superfamily N-acetyltransferase
MEAITTVVGDLSELDAKAISACLTWAGSDFQTEIMNRENSKTPIAILRDGPNRVVAWAATHLWERHQTLEGFTHPDYRRKGLARVAASLLIASGSLDLSLPIAVFSPECLRLAASLGFADVRLFERCGNGGWRITAELLTDPSGGLRPAAQEQSC